VAEDLAQLRLENQMLKSMVKQRGAMAVGVLAEGLRGLIADAQAGDSNAAQLLGLLARSLRHLEDDYISPLTVVRND
jgi:hypothetical protein